MAGPDRERLKRLFERLFEGPSLSDRELHELLAGISNAHRERKRMAAGVG